MTLRDATALAGRGLVSVSDIERLDLVAHRYAVAVTPEIAGLINRHDSTDPIARQFVPDARELETTDEERYDPIGDDAHSPCPGIVHRYPDRVLLKLVQSCAVYCRFCFRREAIGPGRGAALSDRDLDAAIAYIAERRDIWEVILTGGDPLTLSPRRLRAVSERLAGIDHLRIVRVHTRLPIVAPSKIESGLINALRSSNKTIYVAIHANHPRELTTGALEACARLADAGFVLISQTVLLRGVNDDVETLSTLMRRFVQARIVPYYLHHPDLAPGTAHFRLSIEEGQALVRDLLGRLSGLCQPRYVLDIPGGHGKSPIGPNYVETDAAGLTQVTDYTGVTHSYPPSRCSRAALQPNTTTEPKLGVPKVPLHLEIDDTSAHEPNDPSGTGHLVGGYRVGGDSAVRRISRDDERHEK